MQISPMLLFWLCRGNRPFPNFKEKILLLVDDGIATGATMKAVIDFLTYDGFVTAAEDWASTIQENCSGASRKL